jgi:hypothetical protein
VDDAKLVARGSHRQQVAGMEVAGRQRKQQAVESIEKAIEVAKAKGDATSKIDAAIARVHFAGELKH